MGDREQLARLEDTLALAASLETVYAMTLAWFIFPGSEQLTWRFYAGTAVLLGLVAVNTWLKRPRLGVLAPKT